MKPVDFNVHLPGLASATGDRIREESAFDGPALLESYARIRAEARARHDGLNIMVFNPALATTPEDLAPLGDLLRGDFGPLGCLTLLVPLDLPPSPARMSALASAGVRAIKFHSYVQRIGPGDFPHAVAWARAAEEAGLLVCVDASYGGRHLFQHDNLLLATAILEHVTRAPVILLHSGGLRALEAMLIAADAPNVWLESSFSLDYYAGSRVEADLAFCYHKVGPGRVLYASDFPYVSFDRSLSRFGEFCRAHGFTSAEQATMEGANARRLLAP